MCGCYSDKWLWGYSNVLQIDGNCQLKPDATFSKTISKWKNRHSFYRYSLNIFLNNKTLFLICFYIFIAPSDSGNRLLFPFLWYFPIFKIIACCVVSGCKKYRPLPHQHFSTVSASEVFTARYISKLSTYLIPNMQ